MKVDKHLTDATILKEMGNRLARRRLELNLTQVELAFKAGVSKSTLERIEAGKSTQLTNYIRILRGLDLIHIMDSVLPQNTPGPIELIKNKGKERKRATPQKRTPAPKKNWHWGDES